MGCTNLHVTPAVAQPHNYHGITFEPDERVMFMFGSANHDETYFSRPHEFEITRDTSPNLTFGAGLMSALARPHPQSGRRFASARIRAATQHVVR